MPDENITENSPSSESENREIEEKAFKYARGEDGRFVKKSDEESKSENDSTFHYQMGSDEVDVIPLKKFYGLEALDTKYNNDLLEIVNWARGKGIKTEEDLLLAVKRMEQKLGPGELGESKILRLKNYLKLDKELDSVFKEMSSYEK